MRYDIILTIDLKEDLFTKINDFINKNKDIEEYYDGWGQCFKEDDTTYMTEQQIFFYDVPFEELSKMKITSYIMNIEIRPQH